MGQAGWWFWIDRGGTFTDVVARDPQGEVHMRKLLSVNPDGYADAAVQAIRDFLGLTGDERVTPGMVQGVKMGTTVATNALLERQGTPVLLVTNRGFGDVLTIGDQSRPDIFARNIEKVLPLHEAVLEIDGRLDATGREQEPLQESVVREALAIAHIQGFEAVAVCLMHAYLNSDHEVKVAKWASQVGFTQVSLSHEVSSLIKLVDRGQTTVADAYLSPVLRRYVRQVEGALGGTRLWFMQSNGGLAEANSFRGKDAVLSGPAGGMIGAIRTAEEAGFKKMVSFDMGGTSTDVAHFAGELERVYDREIAGTRIAAPMMAIHTVAAGGGSVISYDGARFRVGPESAGAHPGPACYGRGGPLTVTDCNLILGRLIPSRFPAVFGPHGSDPLNLAAAQLKLKALAEACGGRPPELVAEGCLDIAVENMAQAIKSISVSKGYDVRDYVMNAFGGAAGQLACRVADVLGMSRILVHRAAGVLSAYGIGLAKVRHMDACSVERPLTAQVLQELSEAHQRMAADGADALARQGARVEEVHRRLWVKYEGTDQPLQVALGNYADVVADFTAQHRARYGFELEGKPLVLAAIAVEASGAAEASAQHVRFVAASRLGSLPQPLDWVPFFAKETTHHAPVYAWEDLPDGALIEGPAILVNDLTTVVVDPGWEAHHRGYLLLQRKQEVHNRIEKTDTADPVLLELFNRRYMAIAEQMGHVLRNTASSVNIKERLDFSCAVFDREGRLIANAPHMPVHLGSMGASLRSLITSRKGLFRPGQVFAGNNPFDGGTHLPDVTVMAPVFCARGEELLFFTAARGHHADIGGMSPGSMPPFSRNWLEEGVRFDNLLLVEDSQFREQEVREVLATGPYPARAPERNLADLRAQVAACAQGSQALLRLLDQYGRAAVLAYMDHIRSYAESCVRRAIGLLKAGHFRYAMDDGTQVQVRILPGGEDGETFIDFSGTSDQQPNNFNAPTAVCRAAVLYVFRTLVQETIPLNEGCLAPLRIHIPPGCMLNPRPPAAVVGGNVETSQVVVDALYGALGVMAAAQGTMNNLTFGNEQYQYYETLCGGAGAGPDFHGADAVHTHMTNSRITDPEVLELRFPVQLRHFGIRPGSGGDGLNRGGDGVIRRFRFLEPMQVGLLANRHKEPPFGLAGGAPGQCGRAMIQRADGTQEKLESRATAQVQPGDELEIRTPGGGGWGKKS